MGKNELRQGKRFMLSYRIALSNELLPKHIVLEICENKFRGVPLKIKINQWSNIGL